MEYSLEVSVVLDGLATVLPSGVFPVPIINNKIICYCTSSFFETEISIKDRCGSISFCTLTRACRRRSSVNLLLNIPRHNVSVSVGGLRYGIISRVVRTDTDIYE